MSLLRMAFGARAVLAGALLAAPAIADPPAQSIIPLPRPGEAVAVPAEIVAGTSAPVVTRISASNLAPGTSLRPAIRPGHGALPGHAAEVEAEAGANAEAVNAAVASALSVPAGADQEAEHAADHAAEPEPEPRRGLLALLTGQNRRTAAAPGRAEPPAQAEASGGLCGVPGITGERLATIPGRLNGCGIAEPVRISAINGITFSQRPTLNCQAARALQGWLTEDVVPEVGRRGGGVVSVRVIGSYSCRTRNSQPGARLSEHATGNAMDIAGFGLADGREITVLSDWGSGAEGRILRNLHRAACGRFGTVLGPNADRYHRDHFHVDVASYRSGTYCR
jgi:hypothetical protein